MGKYDHLEELRQKLASRAGSKKASSTLVSLWLQFDECLDELRPSCKENDNVIKRLRQIQSRIKKTIDTEAEVNV